MMRSLLLLLPLLASALVAAPTPYSVALLTQEKDETVLTQSLKDALGSEVPLVRATAARVVAVRGVTAFLPQLRERVEAETDAAAARELIRAIGILGVQEDVAAAAKVSARWPASMDEALATAVARNGGASAIQTYNAVLRSTRMRNHSEFFELALWGRTNLIAFAGSRMLAGSDEPGWRGFLRALEDSSIALDPGVLAASLDAEPEGIRAASVWYLIHGYAADPAVIPAALKEKLSASRGELSSDREDFGHELLRRMLGGERRNQERWLKFLAGDEADTLLHDDESMLQYLTDEEYGVQYDRCKVRSRECVLPRDRGSRRRTIASQPVAPPAFTLPELLPAGLADAIVSGARCDGTWLGVAGATVDSAGRIQTLDLAPVGASASCKRALETLLRASFAGNTSMRSPFTGGVLLAHARNAPMCLDESLPQSGVTSTFHTGGAVQAPKVKKRVEPRFPTSALNAMGSGRNVLVIVEAVISKEGCVRSIRLIEQSPYPELNGAALMALSQWQFVPGYLDGKPVDVVFNLTVNFKTS